jgi:hypothetical protein
MSKHQSIQMKKRWSDPKWRAKQVAAITEANREINAPKMKERWADPEWREKQVAAIKNGGAGLHMREKWKDPKLRAEIIANQNKGRQTSEYKKKLSERMKDLWANKGWRKKVVRIHKKSTKHSEASKALWETPEFRQKMQNAYESPEYKEKHSAGLKRAWADGTRNRAEFTAKIKAYWDDPKYRANRLAAMMADWKEKCLYAKGRRYVEMRSWWEVAFAEWCDKQKLKWRYEPKRFNIGKGDYNGVFYTPDFFVINWNCYIEVKGLVSTHFRNKFAKMSQLYKDVQVVLFDQPALRKLGIVRGSGPHAVLSADAQKRYNKQRAKLQEQKEC